MTSENPYASPFTAPPKRRWQPGDVFAATVWTVIPIGVFLARRWLMPIFADFNFELPMSTQLVIARSSNLLLVGISPVVVWAILRRSDSPKRRTIVVVACIVGALLFLACALAFFAPLIMIWQNFR